MSLLVRTWNLFHGRTSPPSGALHLERMVRTAVEDGPDVVAFQEVPVWALGRLEAWSGMNAVGAIAMLPLGGPLAGKLTKRNPRRFRSLLTGQANALLLSRRLELVGTPRAIRLNPGPFRSAEARARRLSLRERLDWAWNRRVCQAVHVRERKRVIVVANLHATKDHSLAEAEVDRLALLWPPEAPTILCGDFNARGHALPGFSEPLDGIDQILVRGLEYERKPSLWPIERRQTEDGAVLSDHAPVEAVVA
ncbi:MAG TPA: endonuclease/exonuclease/phosphatase family protein [Gaiellaceae bacterium]|nr:endonuclease/exonuclease/phosphatase family protein [Gaiellaceae bacterium]